MEFFNQDFWRDFVSNGGATLLGAIVGIPIALWISNFQGKREENERKKKILNLLFQELLTNLGTVSGWKRRSNNFMIESLDLIVFLKLEHWDAFSDGGELQWIKNPTLLGTIAEAYNYIRMLRELCSKYFEALPIQKFDQSGEFISEVQKLVEKGIGETIIEIGRALEAIEAADKDLFKKEISLRTKFNSAVKKLFSRNREYT